MTEFFLEYDNQEHPVASGKAFTVGSGAACDLQVQADGVEEEHVVLRLEGDRVVLQSRVPGERDARVNGVAVHAAPLEAGDAIQFGDVEATFEMIDDEPKLRLAEESHDLVRGVNAIGRDPESGVVLDHESVSRKHAAILILPSGQIVVRDLGSANGTTIKGRRLGEVDLQAGDEIRIGDALLHVRRKQGAPETPSKRPSGAAVGATVVGSRTDPVQDSEQASSAPKLELEFRGNKHQLAEGTVRIGRATDCDIVIDDDAQVSRHHAEVEVSGSLVMLRDLGSSNGTRLNGKAISRANPIQDGDRIGIGGQEIKFSAEIPVTPFGQTMVARDLPGAAGRTAVGPAKGTPESVGEAPSDRESALRVLDLGSDAGEGQIQQRYRELYSEFQIRLTNAPTAELKATYERRLNHLRGAAGILLPKAASGATSDLPALKPGEDDAGAAASSPAGEDAVDAAPAEAKKTGVAVEAAASPAATAVGKEAGGGLRGLPRSTMIVGGACALLLGGVIFAALGAVRAGGLTAGLRAELEAKTTELEELESTIPETQQAFEALAEGKGQLVEQNLELKICNHSSAPLTWVWLNAAWFDPEMGNFKDFDTAYDTQWEYLYYNESIPPGGTFSGGRWVVGEQRVWDGSALFFAARLEYRGEEVLRAGAMPAFGGDCYPLNLDR